MIALIADGDISQYHYIMNEVSVKTIIAFLKYRVRKNKIQAESFGNQ